ncbi:armadillo-type protein [Mycena vulgaris]|nr:armadillo-type protein [Mycena vulgaris]
MKDVTTTTATREYPQLVLAKLRYHRQVVRLIKQQTSYPLSASEFDPFIPYLQSNQIRSKTKIAILKEIESTIKFDVGMFVITETEMVPVLVEILRIPRTALLESTCSVWGLIFSGLGKIPGTDTRIPSSIYTSLGSCLLELLRSSFHSPLQIRKQDSSRSRNTYARPSGLYRRHRGQIPPRLDIMGFLPVLVELLNSVPDEGGVSVLMENICSPVDQRVFSVLLPHLERSEVSKPAIEALSYIGSPSDARDVFEANALPRLVELLRSPDPQTLHSTCTTLSNISSHITLISPVFHTYPARNFILVLRSVFSSYLKETASEGLSILSQIRQKDHLAFSRELGAAVPAFVACWACSALGDVARRDPLNRSLVDSAVVVTLIEALSDPHIGIKDAALNALSIPTGWVRDAARAHTYKKFVPPLVEFLGSSDHRILQWACSVLGDLVNYRDNLNLSMNETRITRDMPGSCFAVKVW